MLEPQSRRHLMEALRPPADHALDRAIGTTFTLDLFTLLTVPLSFTLFGWEDEDGTPPSDPLTLFEGLRRFSGRMAVFCDAGHIAAPTSESLLLGYLEDSVVEVTPPTPGHIFHPKVWVLRFLSEDETVRYRLLVASRNLTFDRSWDTLLVLEGELAEQDEDDEASATLAGFVETLPEFATGKVAPAVRENVKVVGRELRKVTFDPPPGFTRLDFWPLGIGQRRWPFVADVEGMLCVSPFATSGLLNKIPGKERRILVSRPQELDKLKPETIGRFSEKYVLRQEAEDDESEAEGADDIRGVEADEGETLRGLHAKLYVADCGREARVWTGSANATHAAFNGNIEFLVELGGEKNECGIDRMLHGVEGETSLRQILQEYTPPDAGTDAETDLDSEREQLQAKSDEVRRRIVRLSIKASVSGSPDEHGRYAVDLKGTSSLSLAEGESVRCRPITVGADRFVSLKSGEPNVARFDLSLQAITTFFVFEVAVEKDGKNLTSRFVLNVPMSGAPDGRREAILSTLLSDPRRVIRLIMMLLAEGGGNEREIALALGTARGTVAGGNGTTTPSVDVPLFEELVRALWNNPRALDRIDEMLAAIRRNGGDHLIPEGLDEVWPQIMQARSELVGEKA